MEIFLGLNQLFIRAMTLRTVENKIDVVVVWHQKPENEKRCKIKCQLQNKTKQGTEKKQQHMITRLYKDSRRILKRNQLQK